MKEPDISSNFLESQAQDDEIPASSSESNPMSHISHLLPEISDFSRLEKLNNEGTTCIAYKWKWRSRVYFVKRLKPEYIHSPRHRNAFEKEFELGSRLSHPSLPRYIDFRQTENECYIVMEYIDGKTLKELWHQPITADRQSTYRIMNQLIDVLEYLHRNNIMHYDLLPQNVMLTTGLNNVVLIDLDKAFNSGYVDNCGDPSRFCPEILDEASSDVDFRGISIILSKGLWGCMEYDELKHFNDLCNKPHVTAEELREALAHKYDDVYIDENKCIRGRTCEVLEGEWQLYPVMIKRLIPDLQNNQFYLEKIKEEFDKMHYCEDPTFAYYHLIRTTPEKCFIVIDRPDGISISGMMAQKNPWIYDDENIKYLIGRLLSSFFYLWEEGWDAMNFEIEDIFINSGTGEIKIANYREVLDATVSDTEERWTESEVRTVSGSGKIVGRHRVPMPDASRIVEFPQLWRIIDQMDKGGVDMSWLSKFQRACAQGASYRALSNLLKNSSPY